MAQQEWFEKAAESHMHQTNKANRELCRARCRKLDKASAKAIHTNLEMEFRGLALCQMEYITKLWVRHEQSVQEHETEIQTLTEPIKVEKNGKKEAEEGVLEDDEESKV